MAIQAELLPLGYYIPINILDKYAEKIRLSTTDKLHAQSYAMVMALKNADAEEAIWATGIYEQGNDPDATFLQISGGGGPNEWRIAKDAEKRIVDELGLDGEPVRFEPDDFVLPRIRTEV